MDTLLLCLLLLHVLLVQLSIRKKDADLALKEERIQELLQGQCPCRATFAAFETRLVSLEKVHLIAETVSEDASPANLGDQASFAPEHHSLPVQPSPNAGDALLLDQAQGSTLQVPLGTFAEREEQPASVLEMRAMYGGGPATDPEDESPRYFREPSELATPCCRTEPLLFSEPATPAAERPDGAGTGTHSLHSHVLASTPVDSKAVHQSDTRGKAAATEVFSDSEDGEVCAICLNELDSESPMLLAFTSCTHQFHSGCVREWMKTKGTCPICRRPIVLASEAMDFPVEEVLKRRQVWKKGKLLYQYRVRWAGGSSAGLQQTSWEPEQNLQHIKGQLLDYDNLVPREGVRRSGRTPVVGARPS